MKQWITVPDVQSGYKDLYSEETANQISGNIQQAQRDIRSDLSGTIDMKTAEDIRPFPDVLKDLAIYKARELALIFYYKDPEHPSVVFNRDAYLRKIGDIRKGYIRVYDAAPGKSSAAHGEFA